MADHVAPNAAARSRRHRAARRFAGALMAVLAVTSVIPVGVGAETDELSQATIERQAYFTASLTDALPESITDGVPPSVVCLVAGLVGVAQVCGDEVIALKDTLNLNGPLPLQENTTSVLPQPVVPDTLPIGLVAGVERYASAVLVDVPPVPDGEQVDAFELVFHEDALTFGFDSPAFRELVLAALLTYEEQDPDPLAAFVEAVATNERPLLEQTITGIEACPILTEWVSGETQDISDLPDTDCLLGSTGIRDTATGTWTFDLTYAAQAWADGMPNEGVTLRPVAAENLAFGDPDVSTSWLVSLYGLGGTTGSPPELALTTSPVPIPAPAVPIGSGPVATPDVFAVLPSTATAPQVITTPGTPGTPDQVIRRRVPQSAAPAAGVLAAREAGPLPLWGWILVLGGVIAVWAYGDGVLGTALTAAPAPARTRRGAMSRLVERRGG